MADTIRLNLNNIKAGLDVLFLIKPSATKLDKDTLEKETYAAITKNIQINVITK